MSKTEPTPGKWEIERPCGFPYTGIFIVLHSANDSKQFHHYIAEVRQLRERGESLANATLLVAAKETAAECDRLKFELHRSNDLLLNLAGCLHGDVVWEIAIAKRREKNQAAIAREIK